MSEAAGRVVAVTGEYARVECAAESSGCAACARGRGCSWQRAGRSNLRVPVGIAPNHLRPGDIVLVAVDDGEMLQAAARLYLPPLLGLLLAPALLRALGVTGDLPAVLGAAAGLGIGAFIARTLAKRLRPRLRVRRLDGRSPSALS